MLKVGSGRVLRNWRLLGSANGSDWVCLREHEDDWTITSAACTSDPLKDSKKLLRKEDFREDISMHEDTSN